MLAAFNKIKLNVQLLLIFAMVLFACNGKVETNANEATASDQVTNPQSNHHEVQHNTDAASPRGIAVDNPDAPADALPTTQSTTTHNSDLRPGQEVAMEQVYTDTIEFSAYDDDYDYFMLLGKKQGKPIALIYNWDHVNKEQYNFSPGEPIEVRWKIDRIQSAGDEEVFSFMERAIDAKRINAAAHEAAFEEFIPAGYVVREKIYGDLNKDGEEDCILLIKGTDAANWVVNRFDEKVDRNRRGLVVLFKNKNAYQLAAENRDCFLSENEDGGVYFPPELSIETKNGNLLIHYGHGRYGTWQYLFRYQEDQFKLIGYDSSSNYGPIINTQTSINFLTQ
ncbi:MAG: hypothetical protein AAFO94_12840, partial [Bacteroidota bacterium]